MYIKESLIESARKINLEDYLRSKGYTLKKEGFQYKVKDSTGLIVKNNIWYNHSTCRGGNSLDFLIDVEGIKFIEAVKILTENEFSNISNTSIDLPKRNFSNKRVWAYLTITRKLSNDIVSYLLKKDLLFESANTHNCVFVSYDENNIVRYAMQRSTISSSNLKFESKGSDKRFSFSLKGTSKRIYVFESIIDLLSYICLYDFDKIGHNHFLSLAGLSEIALEYYLSKNSIDEIVLCLDHDKSGSTATLQYMKKYFKTHLVYKEVPELKDWNEDLKKS